MHTPTCASRDELLERLQALRPEILKLLRPILRDPHLAQDIFQELCLLIYHRWREFDSGRDFEAWAIGIAKNMAFTALRKNRRHAALLEDPVLEMITQEMQTSSHESELDRRKRALRPCLRRMRADHRRLVRSRLGKPRAYAEIAAQTGKSVGALQVVLCRVRDQLYSCIERQLFHDEF